MTTLSNGNPVASPRLTALRQASDQWKRQLLDTARSPLLHYRDLKTGTLDLTPGGPASQVNRSAVDSLLAGRPVRLSRLIAADPENRADPMVNARARLKRIHQVAQTYLEEKGASTLFLAVGLAAWEPPAAGARPNAPVVLLPLSVAPEDVAHREFVLEAAGDAHFNPIMAHSLRNDYGAELTDDDFDLDELPNSFAGMQQLLTRVAEQFPQVKGLQITPRLVVGNFRYNNLPLVNDLEQNLEAFAANDLVAAIAGAPDAKASLTSAGEAPLPAASLPDTEPPEAEFLVLDADASQHQAINWALLGKSGVVWGPPGTGKSQTIANLIAALVASSRKVLFVAQKQAAVEVVISRLKRAGLEDLVMDCHGGFKSRREFSQGLAEAIQRIQSTPEVNCSDLHQELFRNKQALVEHARTLHTRREPWGVSAFEVQTELMQVPEEARTNLRLSREQLNQLNRERLQELLREVQQWVDLEGPWLSPGQTERYPDWAGAAPASADEVRQLLDLVRSLLYEQLPQCHGELSAFAAEVHLELPEAVADWPPLTKLLVEIEQYQTRFHPGIYQLNLGQLLETLAPRSGVGRWLAALSPTYRAARRAVREQALDEAGLSGDAAYQAVAAADAQVRRWQEYCRHSPAAPQVPENAGSRHERVAGMVSALERLAQGVNRPQLPELSLEKLRFTLERMLSQQAAAARLPQLRALERRFNDLGIGQIISVVGRSIPEKMAAPAIEYAWLQGVWSELNLEDSRLAGFAAAAHNRAWNSFASLDAEHLRRNPERIRRLAAQQAVDAMNEYPRQTELVRREAVKKSRHLSVRQLVSQAPQVLCGLRPCWMMSPLQVAEMIPADTGLFDVVIFDEASQIPPAEAIGALARAGQAIVAGDNRQLPPTSFFRSAEPEEDDDFDADDAAAQELAPALTTNIESILDVVKGLPIREQLLKWHYRSRDGRLIAFSNNHIYGKALTAFPGTVQESPLAFHQLELPPIPGSSTRSHPDEVEKVVDLILAHARQYPGQSLGVIAFGSHHAENIEEGLRRRLAAANDGSLDEFFASARDEAFFVKNIERVQGDERDVIILSVGYHKAANGALPYRFGPLNQEGGERRLNVAVTRARARVHLVAGFSHHDMAPGRSSAKGVELLRQYLEFAASGGTALGGSMSSEPQNAFELSIMQALEQQGIPVTPQYGVAGYRLDFACGHPAQPGRMVLAIEADGAAYHSTPTARDRDRLRQQVLENLGWRFHRIWSTEWFRNPQREANLAFAAWRKAVELSDRAADGPGNASVAADPPPPPPPLLSEGSRPRRGPRPSVRPGFSIDGYSHRQLVALADWLLSDTLLRTDAELERELRWELGFSRGGSRINAALQQAIAAAKAGSKQ